MFEERGYLVQQRLSGISPSEVDADVIFMTRAMHFLCSHGTFSTMIAKVVDYFGGMVYAPARCLKRCSEREENRTDFRFREGRPLGWR